MSVSDSQPVSVGNLRAVCSALVARIDSLASRVTLLEASSGGGGGFLR